MAWRLAPTLIVTIALAVTTVEAGFLAPADDVVLDPTLGFEADPVNEAASCAGSLQAGAAAVDVSPYDPLSWSEPYEDGNGNGVYDAPDPTTGEQGDPYEDVNLNGKFDGLFMAGYGHKKSGNAYYMAESVHDPVWARAVTLTCGDTTIGMVSVDTVGLFRGVVLDVRERAPDAYTHVVVASTHTHDSVDTMGLWGPNMFHDGKHPAFMEHVKTGILQALDDALADRRSVDHVTLGAAHMRDLIPIVGTVQTDLRDPFVVDDTLVAARLVDTDGATIATVVNWSPHPETLAGTRSEISSDYPHWLREAIETTGATVDGTYRPPVGGTTVFFSGAVGGMMTTLGAKPLDEAGNLLPDHSYAKAARIGEVAAWAALDALSTGHVVEPDGLKLHVRETSAFGDNPFLLALNTIGIFDHELALGPALLHPVGPTGVVAPSPFFRVEVNLVTLLAGGSQALQVFTIPGELLPEVALGNPLGHDEVVTPETCWGYNADKELFNGARESRPDPFNGGTITAGFERQLAANPHQPKEPAFLRMSDADYVMLLGLANDELGYIVPADDHTSPTVFPGVYSDGTDRCGDDDHYEETVSASSYLAPVVANALARMVDPGFTPAKRDHAAAGLVADDGTAWELDDGVGSIRGAWVDTSRSGGYEATEDTHLAVGALGAASGCRGFVSGNAQDLGETPGEEVRGFWVDLDGDCEFDPARDGYVLADAWALSEGQPYWRPS